jgi:MarR family transcriptional regulator for hemolysin
MTHVLDPSSSNSFGALVAHTARLWRNAVDSDLQPFGLTEATWLPLVHLSRAAEPMRQRDLAAALLLDGSSVVRLLDNLQLQGLIQRREGKDRREKVISLTLSGQRMVERIEEAARQVHDRTLAQVGNEDLAAAMRVLEQVNTQLAAERDARQQRR